MEQKLPIIFSDADFLSKLVEENFLENGASLEQIGLAQEFITSDVGRSFVASQLPAAQALVKIAIDHLFAGVEQQFDGIIKSIVSKMGILSLTGNPLNLPMWAHYGSQGNGFVVGLDMQDDIFWSHDGQKRSLLRKVLYTDQITPNFWKNPYYLFLVKISAWSYVEEWRVIRKLSTCDHCDIISGQDICVVDVPPAANPARASRRFAAE